MFLDISDSDFSISNRATSRMRQGRDAEAAAIMARATAAPPRDFLKRCLGGATAAELEPLVAPGVAYAENLRDGEQHYWFGSLLARCGQPQPALRLLARAVERNYCAYPLMETDALLESLAHDPGFEPVRAAGRACHQRFLAHR